ncbi:MAG: hypothetical protein H7Y13_13560 [Sphingobacteriaceae bacterium]|nr:hypothetical protein [Sphingobacteriaceae bacterium]
MKTLKTLAATLLTVLSFSAFAAEDLTNYKHQMDYTIKTYVDAVAHGKLKGVAEVLDSEVKYTLTRGDKILNYGNRKF